MKLEIILRIHDGQNIHGDKPRYIDIPKKDLILGCLTSLINSANVVTDADISFIESTKTANLLIEELAASNVGITIGLKRRQFEKYM